MYRLSRNERKEDKKEEMKKDKKVLASVDEDAWKGYISYGYAPELYLSALKKLKKEKSVVELI